MAAFFALLAFIFGALLFLAATFYFQAKSDLRAAEQDKTLIEEKAKTSLARYKGIADLEQYKADLDAKLHTARALLPKFHSLADMEEHRARLAKAVEELQRAEKECRGRISANESTLRTLAAQTEAIEETVHLQSFGFYQPKYGLENSERYLHQLGVVRDGQKALVKSDRATQCPTEWTVDGSAAKGRKMAKEQSQLMLRAFNGECDAAVGQVKFNSINNMENRIKRSFEAINKLGASKQMWVTHEYLNPKLQELCLVHEHREKVEEEREEQRRIKEQMREEEKALREIEDAKKEAEHDEANKSKALEKGKRE